MAGRPPRHASAWLPAAPAAAGGKCCRTRLKTALCMNSGLCYCDWNSQSSMKRQITAFKHQWIDLAWLVYPLARLGTWPGCCCPGCAQRWCRQRPGAPWLRSTIFLQLAKNISGQWELGTGSKVLARRAWSTAHQHAAELAAVPCNMGSVSESTHLWPARRELHLLTQRLRRGAEAGPSSCPKCAPRCAAAARRSAVAACSAATSAPPCCGCA